MIKLEHVSKTYRVKARTRTGFLDFFHRRYSDLDAVKDISLEIQDGEAVGLIGPNGAGKSTLIKMMVGILQPSDGTVQVFGKIPYEHRKEIAKNIGVVFGQRTQLWWDLPLIDTFNLHKQIYDIPDDIYQKNLQQFRNILGLEQYQHQSVRQLSLGQRVKADLAVALLHSPKLLVLDEPTIGLDVVAKKQIRDFLKKMNQDYGVTILLTSHDLKDIEEICERIIIINHGKIVTDSSLEDIQRQIPEYLVKIVFSSSAIISDMPAGCQLVSQKGETTVFKIDANDISISDFLGWVGNQGKLEDIQIDRVKVEEIVSRIYQEGSEV